MGRERIGRRDRLEGGGWKGKVPGLFPRLGIQKSFSQSADFGNASIFTTSLGSCVGKSNGSRGRCG